MNFVPSDGSAIRRPAIGWSSISSRYVYFPPLFRLFPLPPTLHSGSSIPRSVADAPFPHQFGRGPRTCSGKAITMMEMSKLVPELVLRYNIGLADARHDWTVCNDWFVRQYDFLCTVRARK